MASSGGKKKKLWVLLKNKAAAQRAEYSEAVRSLPVLPYRPGLASSPETFSNLQQPSAIAQQEAPTTPLTTPPGRRSGRGSAAASWRHMAGLANLGGRRRPRRVAPFSGRHLRGVPNPF
mmetsp:Transcript_37953/g.84814  ORF Transcript_37953/g.84814 Transcript_37953/m.84814 type:complete len:119 (-) Transcript_37953:129-485(-)